MKFWDGLKGFLFERYIWIKYRFSFNFYTMKFTRPVESKILVSARYGAKGPFWAFHIGKDGLWKKGVLCLDCDNVFDPLLGYKCPQCRSVNVRSEHKGIDFRTPVGTPVYAMMNGQIELAEWENPTDSRQGFGLRIRQIYRWGGESWRAYYGHLSKINCRPGDFVEAGSLIAQSGDSGHVTGPHLHVEIRDTVNQQHPIYFEEDEV